MDVTLYDAGVRNLIARLILAFAVLLMPFGMATAASGAPHHSMAAEMPMGHCPDQGQPTGMKRGIAECTMACAAALPAVVPSAEHAPPPVDGRVLPTASLRLHGLHPDTATPPPKRA